MKLLLSYLHVILKLSQSLQVPSIAPKLLWLIKYRDFSSNWKIKAASYIAVIRQATLQLLSKFNECIAHYSHQWQPDETLKLILNYVPVKWGWSPMSNLLHYLLRSLLLMEWKDELLMLQPTSTVCIRKANPSKGARGIQMFGNG